MEPTTETESILTDVYDFDVNIDIIKPGTSSGTASQGSSNISKAWNSRPSIDTSSSTSYPSRYGRLSSMTSRYGTSLGGGNESVSRPMTSVTRAGYQTVQTGNGNVNATNQGQTNINTAGLKPNKKNDAAIVKKLEKQVHDLIEESNYLSSQEKLIRSLETAKEAVKIARTLQSKYKNSNDRNSELTFATLLNLAQAYKANEMYTEAIQSYNYLMKKRKQYPSSYRLAVNIGNIYFLQESYTRAIKMYRMTLDQIPTDEKEVGYKICCNIGLAFVKLGRYREAIPNFETVVNSSTTNNFETYFFLMLCLIIVGDLENLKRYYLKLISIPLSTNNNTADDDEDDDEFYEKEKCDINNKNNVDDLSEELEKRHKTAVHYILTASRLIAPIINKQNWVEGYKWIFDQLNTYNHTKIASHVQMEEAILHFKNQNIEKAIYIFKTFEKKDNDIRTIAATNLSCIYFLEGEEDLQRANEYADLAVKSSRYNANALVNKGNCLFLEGLLDKAKELYLEAIGVQADCVEAIYNLGLTNVKLGFLEEALQAFEKFHTIIPNDPEVIYQIANIYEDQNQLGQACKWFNVLIASVPTDSNVLSRLGHIYSRENDDSQGFHYQLESYRYYPANLEVISWLGVWYVRHEMYEKSIHLFERASQIQPTEVKWKLMISSCYRRMGNVTKAKILYEQIHTENPENVECLRYMIILCKDNGYPYEQYENLILKLEGQLQGTASSSATINTQNTTTSIVINSSSSNHRQTPKGFVNSTQFGEEIPAKIVGEDEDDDEEDLFSECDVNELLN